MELTRRAIGLLVAHLQRQQLAGHLARRLLGVLVLERIDTGTARRPVGRNNLVQRRYRMAGADFASVLLVVIEVLGTQQPVLIADQPVRADLRWMELHLPLD